MIRAGKLLGSELFWPTDLPPEEQARLSEAFTIAYSWCDSHAYPMNRLRQELLGKVRRVRGRGITVARLKRMASIRKKLFRSHFTLVQIQDLGGCRAIMDTINEVRNVVEAYRTDPDHEFVRETDYIREPRDTGYRSHHLIFKFKPATEHEEAAAGRRIEVQVRSAWQHVWATAVESVGLARHEDMKGNEGDPDWLRLFELMSSEIAEAENSPTVPGAPDKRERAQELADLDRKLRAVSFLNNIRTAISKTAHRVSEGDRYFLIRTDNVNEETYIKGYTNAIAAAASYREDERKNSSFDLVLIEADKVDNLRRAYPNYHRVVSLFSASLAAAIGGKALGSEPLSRPPPPPPASLARRAIARWDAFRSGGGRRW